MSPEPGFTLLRRGLPGWAERHVVTLRAGESIECDEDLRAAVVVLELGEVMLETRSGGELRLVEGALFCLSRLPVASVRNVGSGVAVLVALRRGL